MMKRILALVLSLLMVVGMAGMAEEAAPAADYTAGTPWLDPEILGSVTEDTPAELKDTLPCTPTRTRF